MSDQISTFMPSQTLAREGQRLDHVAGDDAVDAPARRGVDARAACSADAGAGGRERLDAARQHRAEDAARARRRCPRWPAPALPPALTATRPSGVGDERVVALEHDDRPRRAAAARACSRRRALRPRRSRRRAGAPARPRAGVSTVGAARAASAPRSPGVGVEPVGVEHERRRRRAPTSARANAQRAVAAAEPGPEHERAAALGAARATASTAAGGERAVVVGQRRASSPRAAAPRRSAQRRRARRPSRSRRPRARRPRRPAHGAPVSPREPPATSTWPAVNFVDPAPRAGSSSQHAASSMRPTSRLATGAPVGDADVDHPHVAGVALARSDPQARLGRVEGRGRAGPHGRALDHAGRGVDAAGDVGRDDAGARRR